MVVGDMGKAAIFNI